MYAIRSYYAVFGYYGDQVLTILRGAEYQPTLIELPDGEWGGVITSYSIHYTKLYD